MLDFWARLLAVQQSIEGAARHIEQLGVSSIRVEENRSEKRYLPKMHKPPARKRAQSIEFKWHNKH
jgi:hypothetical protein